MVKLTPEELRACMSHTDRVRNVSVIAHVDHGKTTLTDQLLARAGVLAPHQAGTRHATDTREDEQLRGITIKSTAISLYYELDDNSVKLAPANMVDDEGLKGDGRGFLINLIDSPGHVDFSSEVTAALRLTDGAMVVVDCVSGVCVQTETVLRQAVTERIQPILMMNKLDRCILEKQMDMEDLYVQLSSTLMRVNTIIQTYHDEGSGLECTTLDPSLGNVAMGSGLHGWGFTLPQFAAFYSRRYTMNESKMLQRLWGNHFYNSTTRKWRTSPAEGYVRGFNKFILEPLYKVLNTSLSDPPVDMADMLQRMEVNLSREEVELVGKAKMKAVMRKWLPAGDAMLQMMAFHLPSPRVAQAYRAELLYEGPMDDEAAIAIKNCDPDGPLMLYVSKMVPSLDRGRFLAFGRVFAGTVTSGMQVRILGPDYNPGDNTNDVTSGNITRTVVMMGSSVWPVHGVPSGNVVGMGGIDKFLRKTGTLTTLETAHNMRIMKFSVSPVVQVAVEPKVPSELPKLVEGFKRLVKSDPMVRVYSEESGQNIVAGAGELHLEIILNDLEDLTGIEIKRSEPIVTFRETVQDKSPAACLAKTANKHNRIWLKASPLAQELVSEIEEDKVKSTDDSKLRARYLSDNYEFDIGEAKKIWCFGPEARGPNLLVDVSKGVQSLNSIRDSMVAGFQWATLEGPLCEERMRGVRYDITDARVHSDPAHYRGAQILPAMRRAAHASVISAQASLMEPVYLVDIQCPEEALGGVYSSINPRRGYIFEEARVCGTPLFNLKAYMPVVESFGFTESVRGATSGKAFPQCIFDHWQVMPGDPYDVTSKAGDVVRQCRLRKGMSAEIPGLETYLDRL